MQTFRGLVGGLLFVVLLAGCGSSTKPAPISSGPPTTSVTLSQTSFDFGDNLVGNAVTQTVVKVSNTGTTTLVFSPALTGTPGYSIVAAQSCGLQLNPGASCSVVVQYLPTTPSAPASQTATLNLNYGNAAAGSPATVSLTGVSGALAAGTVTTTTNPLVALYTITPPFAGTVTVDFGTTQSYGLKTWAVSTPNGGGPVSIEVAGMTAKTAYHMQAAVAFENGMSANDIDHTFTTGTPVMHTPSVPFAPSLTATTTTGMTPQPGIELINALPTGSGGLYAIDLSGNVIWNYPFPDYQSSSFIQGFKQLPNGDFLINIGANSEVPLQGGIPAGTLIAVREIDLIGNTVKQLTLAQLNSELTTAGCAECNVNLLTFHHDVEVLPNGHWLILANTLKSVVLNGQTTPTQVLGDVVVDVDTNMQPVWVWNEFNHLDVNRQPYMFPDWTHTNAIIDSKDDGNFTVSIRHQNWLVKVNYANGTGDGSIVWRLGEGGDFTLQNGTDPTDWFYAQHGPSYFSTGNAGIFSLGLMDNGDDRQFPAGVNCGTGSAPPCLYSTVPVMQINESTKTASLTFHQIVPTNLYNSFGGDTNWLQNGNVEYDLCGEASGNTSDVFEVTQTGTPETVWHLHSTGPQLFRTYRYSSLYPGVQW